MVIINGKELANSRELFLREKVRQFIVQNHKRPSLLAIELSDDFGSKLYLKLKQAAAERIGIKFLVAERSDLDGRLLARQVRQDQTLMHEDGIFIQHPPRQKLQEIAAQHLGGQAGLSKKQIDEFWRQLVDQIPPEKDVDCLTTENLNLIKQGKQRFLPATVKAVIYCLLSAFNNETMEQFNNLRIVILGRSPILGLPLSWYLKNLGANVILLHSQSTVNDLRLAISEADIVVSSVGKPKIITGGMVKNGAIVIDCGSPVGDVDFSSVAPKVSAITPVPGGVGPLTVVSLMENVVAAAKQQQN